MKTPDSICEEYSSKGVKLNLYNVENVIVIEADATSLEFLGKLFLAQAIFDKDTGFSIRPKGPGNIFFNKKSKYGIYIERISKDEK